MEWAFQSLEQKLYLNYKWTKALNDICKEIRWEYLLTTYCWRWGSGKEQSRSPQKGRFQARWDRFGSCPLFSNLKQIYLWSLSLKAGGGVSLTFKSHLLVVCLCYEGCTISESNIISKIFNIMRISNQKRTFLFNFIIWVILLQNQVETIFEWLQIISQNVQPFYWAKRMSYKVDDIDALFVLKGKYC